MKIDDKSLKNQLIIRVKIKLRKRLISTLFSIEISRERDAEDKNVDLPKMYKNLQFFNIDPPKVCEGCTMEFKNCKKPAAFEKVGAAVRAEAAKAPRTKRLDILWRFIFSKTNRSISHKFYMCRAKAGYYINKSNKKAKI